MRTLHVGCPMWALRPWVGRFLPRGVESGEELGPYSRLLNAVEGNTTFYASPTAATVARWAHLAEPGFRFVLKVPREITHDRRLRDIDRPLRTFVDLMSPLGERIGAFTYQLPASFGPNDLSALDLALRHRPAGWRWAVEVRHPAFFDGGGRVALDRLLTRHGAERVLLDSRPLFAEPPITDIGRQTWTAKPRVPALTEAITDAPIVRVIGSDRPQVTDAGLARWEPIAAAWLREGRTPTVFVHTPDNVDSPGLARHFHERVRAAVGHDDVAALPDPDPLDDQGTLF